MFFKVRQLVNRYKLRLLRRVDILTYTSKVISIPFSEMLLIAHAAGSIDGVKYTNSQEAFTHNYNQGFRVFEIDFILTSDKKLIARHDWINDFGQDSNLFPLSYKQAMEYKIFDKYNSIDFKRLIELMERYEDITVIIDVKIQNPEETAFIYNKISNELKDVKKSVIKRLQPQIFYQSDFQVIAKYNFAKPIYVIGREGFSLSENLDFCKKNGIRYVSLSVTQIRVSVVQTYLKNNIYVYAYTINNKNKIKYFGSIGVKGVFTDLVYPRK